MMSVIEIAAVFAVAIVAVVAVFSVHTRALAREVERARRERLAALARSCPPVAEQTAPVEQRLAPVLQFSIAQVHWAERAKNERSGELIKAAH
jgi:hypothetical protein